LPAVSSENGQSLQNITVRRGRQAQIVLNQGQPAKARRTWTADGDGLR